MANPAVIDAYLGSHHDEDLGDLDTGVMTAIKELADDDADKDNN
jgi:branched-chain amino acid transport system ATP-binding protein